MSLTVEEAKREMAKHPMHHFTCDVCGAFGGELLNLEPITRIGKAP